MFSEYKYKIELHAHTNPASSCSDFTPEEVIKTYSEAGVDAVVITNHFCKSGSEIGKDEYINRYLGDYRDAVSAGKKYGVNVILGMELRFSSENNNDYLVFGIDEDFISYAYDFLDCTLEEAYPHIKNDKNLIIQAHPKRKGIEPVDSAFLDGIEAFNMHPGHNNSPSMACKIVHENPDLLIIAGSDYHHKNHEAGGLILSKNLPSDSFELTKLLKSRDYLMSVGGYITIPYL